MLKNRLYLYGNDNVRVPAHLNFGKEVYDNMVQNKDHTALINADSGAQITYGEVAKMTADIALSLTRMGVGKGDVVCICSVKNFEYLPTVMGIICFTDLSNVWKMSKGIRVYNSGEFYTPYGFLYALACLRANATIVYNPSGGGEKNMLEAVQKYKLQALQLSPMVIIGLATSAILDSYDVSTVEHIVPAGIHFWDETVRGIKKRFPNPVKVLRQYGMTETGLICHEQFATKGSRAESSGRPANGVVIKVVDLETREPLGPNQRGEICVKGYCVIKAYSNNAVPDFKDEEGFLKTGDMGYYDVDGYIYIVNRLKEMIKFDGINVAPGEFEAVLLQHPSVREAGVVGKPHPKHGEVPVAFIVLQPGCSATEEELVQYVDSQVNFIMRLAGGVRFIDRLPRFIGDKLDRKNLLQRLLDEDANSGGARPKS